MDKSQINKHQEIKKLILAGTKVSQLSVLRDFGCMRLAVIINRLRDEGIPIRTETRKNNGGTYAVYRLEQPKPTRGRKNAKRKKLP